jgi:hypothetical protein
MNLALQAGFDTRQVLAFLETESGAPPPPAFLDQLNRWAAGYRRIRTANALVVTPDDASWLPELIEIAKAHDLRYQIAGEHLLVFPALSEDGEPPVDPAFLFRQAGFSPQPGPPRAAKTSSNEEAHEPS